MIHTLFLTKVCPEEDINEVCEIMTESVTEFTNLIFDHIYLDKDRKLNLENVFEQLEHQAGDQLCNFSPHLSKFIKFQDQPCEYQCDSEESSERPGKELSFLYLLSLNRPCTTAFTAPISY